MIYYLIGSLRNPEIPKIANYLKSKGIQTFSSWFAAGPIADDSWQTYETERGLTYMEALNDYAAEHVFNFDLQHLDRCHGGILVYPAGKSAHLELGYMAGQRKPTYILLDKIPERWDVMTKFASSVTDDIDKLIKHIQYDERLL